MNSRRGTSTRSSRDLAKKINVVPCLKKRFVDRFGGAGQKSLAGSSTYVAGC